MYAIVAPDELEDTFSSSAAARIITSLQQTTLDEMVKLLSYYCPTSYKSSTKVLNCTMLLTKLIIKEATSKILE